MQNEEEKRWETLGVKAQDLVRLGNIDEAIDVVAQIPMPRGFSGWGHEKVLALIEIAIKLIELGKIERATSIADEASGCCEALHDGAVWEEADCYAKIASIQAKLNMRSAAILMWRKAVGAAKVNQTFDVDCAKILAKIARDLADIGEHQFANDVARSVVLDELQRKTLAYISKKK